MRILGIDPGLATLGWGLVEKVSPHESKVLRYGCITTPSRHALPSRLMALAHQIQDLVFLEKPEACAVEELYFAKDSRTAASVAHARGVILYVLQNLNIAVFEYNPRQIKMALTGYGAADKFQMQHMVQRLLRLKELPRPDDAADALAVALCHINTFRAAGLAGFKAKSVA